MTAIQIVLFGMSLKLRCFVCLLPFRIVDERFTEIIQKPLAFENCAYELRISGTVSTDKRIMSFVNVLWGFEVTGGIDQYEPLTIINVSQAESRRFIQYSNAHLFLR